MTLLELFDVRSFGISKQRRHFNDRMEIKGIKRANPAATFKCHHQESDIHND